MEHTVQLTTRSGPAAFRFRLTPAGRLTGAHALTLDLPEALLRLTYPNDSPEGIRDEVMTWLPVLPWLVETALWLEQPPAYLAAVQQSFRAATPAYEELRERVLAAGKQRPTEETPAHWVRMSHLFTLGVAELVANFPEDRSPAALAFSAAKSGLPLRETAAAWLTTAFDLCPARRIDEWLVALGKTRTHTANDYLFRELERPGYLPYAKNIYSVLANSRLKLDTERILRLYDDENNVRDSITAYIHLLNQLPFPLTRDLLIQIVAAYPQDCVGALKRIKRHDSALVREVIRAEFLRTEDYRTLAAMLRYAVELLPDPAELIPLADINNRLAESVFLDDAQVTWPQKLATGWETILKITPAAEFVAILETHLPNARGRVARNLLLQLREYLSDPATEKITLPVALERIIIGLLKSRHDKVSTVATDVIRLLLPNFSSRVEATKALLQHLPRSRYKLMDSAALKALAQTDPESTRLQTEFLEERRAAAVTDEEKKELKKLMPYFRFL